MATEVTLIMSSLAKDAEASPYDSKNRVSLQNTLAWLDERLPQVISQLPASRAVSFFEVTLFCFVMHLEFRKVFDTSGFAQLASFCSEFGRRAAARATTYAFD